LAFFLIGSDASKPAFSLWRSETMRAFRKLNAAVTACGLTDYCSCHCSSDGCTPFIYFMKAHAFWVDVCYGNSGVDGIDAWSEHLQKYHETCDSEAILQTYAAAIRYATFEALGLEHTCCVAIYAPHSDIPCGIEFLQSENVGEWQATLVELLESLTVELIIEARKFLGPDKDSDSFTRWTFPQQTDEESESDTDPGSPTSSRSTFSDFWPLCWWPRVKKELERLELIKLTEAERRAAEEIGVRWEQPTSTATDNPYSKRDIKHWYFQLDRIYPEPQD
jgi:hypothetical protein